MLLGVRAYVCNNAMDIRFNGWTDGPKEIITISG